MGPIIKKVSRTLRRAFLPLLFTGLIAPAHASPEVDRVYQLESIGWLKPSDNLDGVFSDYLEEQYSHYFSGQGRFIVKPLKGLGEVFGNSKAKYRDLVQEPEILKKIAQKYQVEDLLRTTVSKEGESYRFEIEWVFAPKNEVLARVEFRYIDEGKEDGIRTGLARAVEKGLEDLIGRLPFLGQVNGVEGNMITVGLGRNVGVKPGQIVTIYSLQSVKRHPLLKTIEEWRWQPIGRAQIEQVDASLSFAKVTQTEPNVNVLRYQKVREILEAPEEPKGPDARKEKQGPKSGWIAANAGLGTYSREVGPSSTSSKPSLLGNFGIDAQIWLNSRFILEGSLGASIFNASSYSGSEDRFRLAVGYSLFPMTSVYDPIAWVHAGYLVSKVTLPKQTASAVSASDLQGLLVGVGGFFNLFGGWNGQLGMDLGVANSATATGLGFGSASSPTHLAFEAAASTRLDDRFFFRTLFRIQSESMSFSAGQSLTQKEFSISPSIMYYF